jgi:nitrogen fixation NifU-like protein
MELREMEDITSLYQEMILYYAKTTKYNGNLSNSNISYIGNNPSCGDTISIEGYINNENKLVEIKVNPKGCFISCASANLMAETIKNKTVEQIQSLIDDFTKFITGKSEKLEKEENKELYILEGVRKFPVRIKCALIAWESCKEALKEWKKT